LTTTTLLLCAAAPPLARPPSTWHALQIVGGNCILAKWALSDLYPDVHVFIF
jgi:hypothetical protein